MTNATPICSKKQQGGLRVAICAFLMAIYIGTSGWSYDQWQGDGKNLSLFLEAISKVRLIKAKAPTATPKPPC